jgi:predicted RNase H-like HicB family nuclease
MTAPVAIPRQLHKALTEYGAPLLLQDKDDRRYVLFEIKVALGADDGFRASIDDFIPIVGEGETQEEALAAFCEILRTAIPPRRNSETAIFGGGVNL